MILPEIIFWGNQSLFIKTCSLEKMVINVKKNINKIYFKELYKNKNLVENEIKIKKD